MPLGPGPSIGSQVNEVRQRFVSGKLLAVHPTWSEMKAGVRRRVQYSGVHTEVGTVLRELDVAGQRLLLADLVGSVAVEVVAGEIGNGAYDFEGIGLRPGDVVIDLGAHVGVVSIFLAKQYPNLRILAFEPMPQVFALLKANLRRNRVRNVLAVNMAVSGHGANLDLVAHLASNTGGGTSCLSTLDLPDHERITVPSITLDQIFVEYDIGRCALLKIDIEGGEHEVLRSSKRLSQVANIRGEFHENAFLRSRGHSMRRLQEYCEGVVGSGCVAYTECYMADL